MSAPALLTDFYELAMAAAYHARGRDGPATFELTVRRMPPRRGFLVACGLETALEHLEALRFDDEALAWLRGLGQFDEAFLRSLAALRFTGEVRAVPEGEVVFAGEPLLEVTAPLVEAQLVESALLNLVAFQTNVATKAARVALACAGRPFADFSLRRDHGPDASLLAARAARVGGADSTSNCLAAMRFGLAPSGTMAHSFVQALGETEAFRAYSEQFRERAVLLVDTFDTARGVRRARDVAVDMASRGVKIRGVRIDSGDLAEAAREARRVLDDAGLRDAKIVLSGDLDEYRIERLLAQGVPADAFGVGTQLGTGGDVPSLSAVYKLVADEHGPRLKLSAQKRTLPGRKQIHRFDEGGRLREDVLALEEEAVPGGRPLLVPVMRGGRRLAPAEPLDALRERCRRALATLSGPARSLVRPARPPVRISKGLAGLSRRLAREQGAQAERGG